MSAGVGMVAVLDELLRRRVYGADHDDRDPAPARATPTASWWAARWTVSSSTSPDGTRATGRGRGPAHRDRRLRTGRTLHLRATPGRRRCALGLAGRHPLTLATGRDACPARRCHRLQRRAHRRAPTGSYTPVTPRQTVCVQAGHLLRRQGPPGHAPDPWPPPSVKVVPPLERSTSSMPPKAARTVQRNSSSAVAREWTRSLLGRVDGFARLVCGLVRSRRRGSAGAAASLAWLRDCLWRLGGRWPAPRLPHAWPCQRAAWHAPQLPGPWAAFLLDPTSPAQRPTSAVAHCRIGTRANAAAGAP